ncbi:MAG: GNAT family N-acetyltransferase [Eisenbergiella massiliensis]
MESRLVGFLGIKMAGDVCKLNDIIILPEYRNNGYGTELLDFAGRRRWNPGKRKLFWV